LLQNKVPFEGYIYIFVVIWFVVLLIYWIHKREWKEVYFKYLFIEE